MIAMLSGKITHLEPNYTIIDVHGVGYGVNVSINDVGNLQIDALAKLYIYEHIRQESHDLFGFLSIDTKQLFEKLLNVNGVGPKMALNIISIGNDSKLKTAISTGDTKYLSSASGVGKRVAERIVVDLKNKVGLVSDDLATSFLTEANFGADEAVEALMSLGYTSNDAVKCLAGIDSNLPTDQRIKLALQKPKL